MWMTFRILLWSLSLALALGTFTVFRSFHQVWESVGALSLFGALAWMHAKLRFFDGQIMATMMVLCSPSLYDRRIPW